MATLEPAAAPPTDTPVPPTPTPVLPTPINTLNPPVATPAISPTIPSAYARPFNSALWQRPIDKSQAIYAEIEFRGIVRTVIEGSSPSTWGPWAVRTWFAQDSDPSGVILFPQDPVQAWEILNGYHCLSSGQTRGASPECETELRGFLTSVNTSPDHNRYSTRLLSSDYQRHDFIPPGYAGYVIQAPIEAFASEDGDAHVAIVQPDGRWAVEMYSAYHFSNGDWMAQTVNFTDLQGDGSGLAGGVRASMIPNMGGLIRNGEMSGPILHALAATLGKPALGPLDDVWAVWPANAVDTNDDYRGQIPMGSLLAIPPDVQMSDYALSPTGQVLFRVLQDYGVYIVDRTENAMGIQAEVNIPGIDWPEEVYELHAVIRPLLRRVSNNPGPGGW